MFRRSKARGRVAAPRTEESIRNWLIEQIAIRVGKVPEGIDPGLSFEEYGLDSRATVQLSGELERLTGLRLSPGLLYEYPTISELSDHLAGELRPARATS